MATRIAGVDRLKRKLQRLPDVAREEIRRAMELGAAEIVALAKSLVPVESGALRESIGFTWGDAPKGSMTLGEVTGGRGQGNLRITIYAGNSEAFYARWQEFHEEHARQPVLLCELSRFASADKIADHAIDYKVSQTGCGRRIGMDASNELIRAIFDRLRTTAAVTELVAQRIYDRVPENTSGAPIAGYPYISLGPSSSIPNDYDCMDGEDITIQLDVWSSGSGQAFGTYQCRQISGAIKRALHDVDLTLSNNALVTLQWELTRILDDPNPAINHGAVQFTAEIETP